MPLNPAYVERRDAIREQLAKQRNRCASCEKMISLAYESMTKKKGAYKLPELGSDYTVPLLCMKCYGREVTSGNQKGS